MHHFGIAQHRRRHHRARLHHVLLVARQRRCACALCALHLLFCNSFAYFRLIVAHTIYHCVPLSLLFRNVSRSVRAVERAQFTTSYSVVSDGDTHKVPASRVERAGGGDGCEDIRWDRCARPSAVRVTGEEGRVGRRLGPRGTEMAAREWQFRKRWESPGLTCIRAVPYL